MDRTTMPPLSGWKRDALNGRPTRSWRPGRAPAVYHVAKTRAGAADGFVGLSVASGRVVRLFTAEGELAAATPMLPQYLMATEEEARAACEHDHLDPTGSVLVPAKRPTRRSNPSSHVQYARVRGGLPWSEEHPLVFHTLTRAGCWPENRGFLEEAVASNMALAPASMRTAALGRVKPIDVEAGDDRFVFFSAAKPYRGDESRDPPWPGGEITLAFDFDDLAARSPFGWRPHDLLHTYEVQAKRGWRRCPQMMRSTGPTSGPELLRKLADLATIFEPAVVRSLVRLYLRFEREPTGSSAQRRTAREAMALCAPYVARFEERRKADPMMRCVRDRDVRFRSPFGVANVAAQEKEHGPVSNWPDSLSWMFGPELLYGRPVPVAEALFFFDPGAGRWFHMHELKLRMGQAALPNV